MQTPVSFLPQLASRIAVTPLPGDDRTLQALLEFLDTFSFNQSGVGNLETRNLWSEDVSVDLLSLFGSFALIL